MIVENATVEKMAENHFVEDNAKSQKLLQNKQTKELYKSFYIQKYLKNLSEEEKN